MFPQAKYLHRISSIDSLHSQHRPEDVEASLDACLAELELDYLDVCIFHPTTSRSTADQLSFTLFTGPLRSRRVIHTSLLLLTAPLRVVM